MNKLIVIVFENEADCYNGLSAMKELHNSSLLTLYSESIISKNDTGEVSVKHAEDNGPIGTALGMTLGGLIGIIGGPIGALAGAYGGSLAGIIYDINKAGVNIEFIDDISKKMLPGTVAILADIEEEWTTPIDTKMKEYNGIVFRKLRQDIEDEQMEKEIEETNKELSRLKIEFDEAIDDAKENISEHIEVAKEKLSKFAEVAKEKQSTLNEEFEEKMKTLKEQLSSANTENKERIEKIIDELNKKKDRGIKKLKSAYEAAKEELEK